MAEADCIPIAVRDLFTDIAAQPSTNPLRSVRVASGLAAILQDAHGRAHRRAA